MELLDVYDKFGNKTGKIIERSKVKELDKDEHIAVGVIFLENREGKFLMQKTSFEKGGLYSSTGGHICSGEIPVESIKREVLEELGININDDKIIELGYILYDRPLRYVFYLKKDINMGDVVTQKEEVDFVEWDSISRIKQLIDDGLFLKNHAEEVYRMIDILKERGIELE